MNSREHFLVETCHDRPLATMETRMTTNTSDTGWVMFENAGTADFYALFFVGFTDKDNNQAAIGMFGSGFNLAIASALRFGIRMILYIGLDRVTFTTVQRSVKGRKIDQLYFVRELPDGTTEEHGTNLTLGYGSKDWKSPWGVYREMLANCRDADPRGYEIVFGLEPKGREGFTRMFVEATEEILAIYRNLCSFSDIESQSMVRIGRKAVRAISGLYRILSTNGPLTAEKLLRQEEHGNREVFTPDGVLARHFQESFSSVSRHLPEVNRLHISFVRLPAHERNVSFITCSRGRGEYQFSETLLKSGPKPIALALIDALAQTKSVSGKCDPRYEEALIQMVLDSTNGRPGGEQ